MHTVNWQRLVIALLLLASVPLATQVDAVYVVCAVAVVLWVMIGIRDAELRGGTDAHPRRGRKGRGMKAEMYLAGFFTSPAGIWRRGDDLEVKARFPVPVYLIETDSERILVDTGLNPGAAEDTASHYGAGDALGMSGRVLPPPTL